LTAESGIPVNKPRKNHSPGIKRLETGRNPSDICANAAE